VDRTETLGEATTLADHDDIALAEDLRERYARTRAELGKLIIGQHDAVDLVLLTLLVGGNSLIVGVPGLAKTLLIRTIADVLDLKFSRIQFTPDLMPADITGTDIVQEDPQTGHRKLVFMPGPVFANILLADEINRTPPKTQAALLEAMQERRVTVQGNTYPLDPPFFVFATQNPIELEGTYPLPEAQLDRFLFEIQIDYLAEDEELDVVRNTTANHEPVFEHAMNAAQILAFQKLVRTVPIAEPVLRYAVGLVRATRPKTLGSLDFINQWVAYGASVRAAQTLVLAAKARALVQGRYHVSLDDLQALTKPVLRHRILRNFQAEAEKMTTDELIERLLSEFKPPQSGL
jgi:MoxR-like ATPase